ncbi:hypothetical protein P7K49_023721 [Saguinus oedipus]|uniref:Uncharacterized protein n=1 Tax=Saguinus oedipus TaxID=9490 RepID=A0ABQ9UMI7_SAGOE|nr:hypothetical protein P7K49_023721 [Saguinus oedipus]
MTLVPGPSRNKTESNHFRPKEGPTHSKEGPWSTEHLEAWLPIWAMHQHVPKVYFEQKKVFQESVLLGSGQDSRQHQCTQSEQLGLFVMDREGWKHCAILEKVARTMAWKSRPVFSVPTQAVERPVSPWAPPGGGAGQAAPTKTSQFWKNRRGCFTPSRQALKAEHHSGTVVNTHIHLSPR